MIKALRISVLFCCALVLSGCRVEVYDQLSQRDANEMTALLLIAGIDAERVSHKDGTFAVSVGEDDFAEAVTLIDKSGLPKPQFASMTDVLSDDRLIASPSEERARLNYALSQELSRTVSDIDGVVIARVHLATPNDDPLSRREKETPTASVVIHHRTDLATDGVVPRIKMLVANAVDGLKYDRVSVALFSTSDASALVSDQVAAVSGIQQPLLKRSNNLGVASGDFEDPAAGLTVASAPNPRQQTVTPAGISDLGMTPILAAVIGGAFVVLLLVGHAILTASRKPQHVEGDRALRHRADR